MKDNYGESGAGPRVNLNVKTGMITAQTLFQWIDLLWVPLALLTMEKGKRLLTCLFVLSCVLMLRLQMELLHSMGFPNGIFRLVETSIYVRGLIIYGFFIGLFLILAYLSKGGDKNVHIAASITILIASFCVSSVVMVL